MELIATLVVSRLPNGTVLWSLRYAWITFNSTTNLQMSVVTAMQFYSAPPSWAAHSPQALIFTLWGGSQLTHVKPTDSKRRCNWIAVVWSYVNLCSWECIIDRCSRPSATIHWGMTVQNNLGNLHDYCSGIGKNKLTWSISVTLYVRSNL